MARDRKIRKTAKSPGEPPDVRIAWAPVAVRLCLAVMFGATLWVTWRLWQPHDELPMLPLFELPLVELPRFPYFGHLMLVGYLAAVRWPRAGLAVSVAFGALAMVADQARMQPTIISLWMLLLSTWPAKWAPWLGRCYLVSLWFFSGFHKLLSEGYLEDGGAGTWLYGGLFPPADWPRMNLWRETGAIVMAAFEVGLAVAALIPRFRKIAAVWAVCLHLGIVFTLHRLGDWNTAVWPWNFALAVVAPWFLLTWKESPVVDARTVGLRAAVAGVALALAPLLYYVGALDAYLSNCLYSANVPSTDYVPVDPESNSPGSLTHIYLDVLNVPLPPEHRNFENYFRRRAVPGDKLRVRDPRRCYVGTEYAAYVLTLESGHVVRRASSKAPAF